MACPKCSGEMEEGFVPDAGHAGYLRLPRWYAGVPEKSFLHGMKVDEKQGAPITVARCTRCGFLEFYARPA